ncbi:MAG: iron ABC transporter ATP-binding protein [Pseudolysinimonas sp.]
MPADLRRTVAPIALAALALALLAGCAPQSDDGGNDPEPTTSSDATTKPTTAPTDKPVGTPIDATCTDLVSADTLYIYNPNFGAIDDFTPDEGTAAASALEYQGLACRWQNLSSGDNIDVSVAQLDDDSLTALKNTAFADSEMVPTYGEEAYFSVEGDIGVAQVFVGSYWIVAESPVFLEPGDATELIDAILAGLG